MFESARLLPADMVIESPWVFVRDFLRCGEQEQATAVARQPYFARGSNSKLTKRMRTSLPYFFPAELPNVNSAMTPRSS